MQPCQHSLPLSDITLTNPIVLFTSGLVIGSIIGTAGVIILGLAATACYYREPLITITTQLSSQLSASSQIVPISTLSANQSSWITYFVPHITKLFSTNGSKKNV